MASSLNDYGLRFVPALPTDCPKKVLFASEPSMRRLFDVPRWPPNERSPARVGSRTTPGVNNVNSRKLRPLIGRLSTCRLEMAVLVTVRLVSTIGASARTVTSAVAEPTCRFTFRVAAAPTDKFTLSIRTGLNPEDLTESSYVPTGSPARL